MSNKLKVYDVAFLKTLSYRELEQRLYIVSTSIDLTPQEKMTNINLIKDELCVNKSKKPLVTTKRY